MSGSARRYRHQGERQKYIENVILVPPMA